MKKKSYWSKISKKLSKHRRQLIWVGNITAFVVLGVILLIITRAATPSANIEPENGTKSSIITVPDNAQASGGKAVRFGQMTMSDMGNILINTTLQARMTQYKTASETEVYQNLTTRGNLEANPAGYNNPNGQGQFRVFCQYSHFNYDDPIVYPGQPGKAHLHMYWGNTGVDANTTTSSLINTGGGTCEGYEANRTGYWMPAVQDGNNNVVIPQSLLMYYKSASNLNAQTKVMPQGLKMIAGNSKGNTDTSLMFENGIQWECYTGSSNYTYEGQTIPDSCPPNTKANVEASGNIYNSADNYPIMLVAIIYFPPCVAVDAGGNPILDTSQDLTRFPSNNHKDHLHYFVPTNGQSSCPASHPYIMPQVSYHVSWPGNQNYSQWHLSSDRMAAPYLADGSSLHADWMGGWNKTVMQHWTEGCINKGQNCAAGVMGTSTNFPVNQQLKTVPTDYSGPNPRALP